MCTWSSGHTNVCVWNGGYTNVCVCAWNRGHMCARGMAGPGQAYTLVTFFSSLLGEFG